MEKPFEKFQYWWNRKSKKEKITNFWQTLTSSELPPPERRLRRDLPQHSPLALRCSSASPAIINERCRTASLHSTQHIITRTPRQHDKERKDKTRKIGEGRAICPFLPDGTVTCGQGWHPGEISMTKCGQELPQPPFAYVVTRTVFPTAGREATTTDHPTHKLKITAKGLWRKRFLTPDRCRQSDSICNITDHKNNVQKHVYFYPLTICSQNWNVKVAFIEATKIYNIED